MRSADLAEIFDAMHAWLHSKQYDNSVQPILGYLVVILLCKWKLLVPQYPIKKIL